MHLGITIIKPTATAECAHGIGRCPRMDENAWSAERKHNKIENIQTSLGGFAAVLSTPTKLSVSKSSRVTSTLVTSALATVLMVHAPLTEAFNFGNMMNPSRWMGNDRYDDRYDDPYWGGPYGGGYGYPGAYGSPYGMPYPVPGYGAPGYGAVPVVPVAPSVSAPVQTPDTSSEVEALKRRIEELEAKQQTQPYARPPQSRSGDWPSTPAFRPMDQY